jgi:hypothetical protein
MRYIKRSRHIKDEFMPFVKAFNNAVSDNVQIKQLYILQ